MSECFGGGGFGGGGFGRWWFWGVVVLGEIVVLGGGGLRGWWFEEMVSRLFL